MTDKQLVFELNIVFSKFPVYNLVNFLCLV